MKSELLDAGIELLSLPPHGGSGLKSFTNPPEGLEFSSPSTRREWIEIACSVISGAVAYSLPPHGGSGLKSDYCNLGDIVEGLPPHGGSGLKLNQKKSDAKSGGSPSTRREWIEMSTCLPIASLGLRLPPHGGSGLKSIMIDRIDITSVGLPPHGGSGLKYWYSNTFCV